MCIITAQNKCLSKISCLLRVNLAVMHRDDMMGHKVLLEVSLLLY